ncbi:MAG: hypothetical protein Kow0037_30370 [Calditrichia bacterium]
MFKDLLHDEKTLSIGATILIHALLILLFMFIQVRFQPLLEEFTEVTLAGGFQAPPMESVAQPQPGEELAEESPEPPANLPQQIELPERRELNLDENELIEKVQPEIEKIASPTNVINKQSPKTVKMPKTGSSSSPFTRREKEVKRGLFSKQLDEKLLQGTQKVDININREFEIDWEGEIRREIYQKRLPEFPPEVQREATIKIKFTVLPNGLVGSAILLQKGDTRLENLTLETFKTWRFNPLPEYVDQKPQSGIITFRFKLK